MTTLVDEAGARATLEKDTIRVKLPLGALPRLETKVVLWLESPKDVRSGETLAGLSPDGKVASAVLPWSKDEKGKPEDDIGWYRVGYRVDVNGMEGASGVLSIGTIATNLMKLRLAYPKLVVQGRGISARVIAVNPVTGRSLTGVRLKATLTGDESTEKKPAQSRTSGFLLPAAQPFLSVCSAEWRFRVAGIRLPRQPQRRRRPQCNLLQRCNRTRAVAQTVIHRSSIISSTARSPTPGRGGRIG